MILEVLLDPLKAKDKPLVAILLAFFYTLIAILLALTLFHSQSSMVFVFLVVLGIIPVMFKIIKNEETKDVSDFTEVALLKEHTKSLSIFMFLFLGVVLATALVYSLFPSNTVATLFSTQIETISSFNHDIGGNVTGMASGSLSNFVGIFINNMYVLIYCILFSFLYGAGAIFILTWNASVIGVAIGNFIRSSIFSLSQTLGLQSIGNYFTIISVGLFKYVIHGIPEILAYFVAGLAGGIICIAVVRHDFTGRKFEHVLLDSADLILISILLIFISAVLEVWVTPIFF